MVMMAEQVWESQEYAMSEGYAMRKQVCMGEKM